MDPIHSDGSVPDAESSVSPRRIPEREGLLRSAAPLERGGGAVRTSGSAPPRRPSPRSGGGFPACGSAPRRRHSPLCRPCSDHGAIEPPPLGEKQARIPTMVHGAREAPPVLRLHCSRDKKLPCCLRSAGDSDAGLSPLARLLLPAGESTGEPELRALQITSSGRSRSR
jgi:hypothetical protein